MLREIMTTMDMIYIVDDDTEVEASTLSIIIAVTLIVKLNS